MRNLYLIPSMEHIEDSLRLSRKYQAGFEYNDFFLPDVLDNKEEVKRRIGFYKSLGRDTRQDMMHGAFLDITIHSDDRKIREISMQRIRQSLDIASELEIRGVVFHTNLIANFKSEAYLQGWVDRNETFFKQMLKEYPGLSIYMENMFDEEPGIFTRLLERMKTEERFGVCLDYAHAALSKTPLKEWVEMLAPYIKHMHINDNDLVADLHLSVGQGRIDWQEFSQLMEYHKIESSVLVEVKNIRQQAESVECMEQNGIYPLKGLKEC